MILELMPYRACYPVFKLVYSASAYASHNMGFKETNLIISQSKVNEGIIVKKLKPQARGRSYPIKRPTCHITIVLKDISKDQDYFIWLRKTGYVYIDKYTDSSKRYLCMVEHERLKWDNEESEGVWDKK
ncbi:hypothetical protein MKX03_034026 [Papaver bracteatum]|nr:hypothetical protein MKX03_034026 [Papaver bracteatum]